MFKYFFITVSAFLIIGCQNAPSQNETLNDSTFPEQTSVEVSEEELDVFIDASLKVQEVQMQMQQTMMEMIESEDMDIEVFNQIATSRQAGTSDEDLNMNTETLEKFDRVSENIRVYGQDMESQLIDSIESEGMELERFQTINTAVQQDTVLQQRLMEQLGVMQAEQGSAAPVE